MRLLHSLLPLVSLAGCLTAGAGGVVTLCATDVQGGPGLNLSTALAAGGNVTFQCKPGTTIEITRMHAVSGRTEIDGDHKIVLKATSYRAMFIVQGDLTLRRMGLHNPYVALSSSPDPRGIVVGRGNLSLIDVQVQNSTNPFSVESIVVAHSRFEKNCCTLITAGVALIGDSQFVNNDGAVVLRHNRPPGSGRTTVASITNSEFRGNSLAILWTGELFIRGSTFEANGRGNSSGGAIRLQGKGSIEHTTFARNHAAEGGAIWLIGGSVALRRATFRNNTALNDGGAVGLSDVAEGSIVSQYSTFTENKADRGGAIKLGSSGAAIALQGGPNTFAQNSARLGGAIYSPFGRIQLVRAVFADNSATVEGGAIFGSDRGTQLATVLANSLTVRNAAPQGSAFSGSVLTLINSTVADNKGMAIHLRPLSHFAVGGSKAGLDLRNALISNNQGGNCSKALPGQVLLQNAHNLQYPGAQCGATVATADPQLDSLFVPRFGSPAYGSGENAVCAGVPIASRDVYGAVRPQGRTCAIGAVEGEVDPRLFRTLLWRLNERVRQSYIAARAFFK